MTIERLPSRLGVRLLLVMSAALAGAAPALAQVAGPAPWRGSGTGYVSASGAVAYGFSLSQGARAPSSAELAAVLADGSSIPRPVRTLIEQIYRASPTFRRQWARLAQARMLVKITLDHEWIADGSCARSIITRTRGLRVHIELRAADPDAARHLAHEIEHALEALDGVDLVDAAARRLHGIVRRGRTFETRRALAIGRQVAAEVGLARAGS